jgi:hypothetical protein
MARRLLRLAGLVAPGEAAGTVDSLAGQELGGDTTRVGGRQLRRRLGRLERMNQVRPIVLMYLYLYTSYGMCAVS